MEEHPTTGSRLAEECLREHLFRITSWAAWTPGRETEASWRDWAGTPGVYAPIDGTSKPSPPALLRRRVSPLGQAALRMAWGLADITDARVILASRHGEFGRTLSILDSLAAGDGVSPADFTLSVHHALLGLLSIAADNHRGHTAIAAGSASFGLGFVEALACLIEQPARPVVLLYYDEALPAPFDHFNETHEQPLVVALTLASSGGGETFGLTMAPGCVETPHGAQALHFLRFILTDSLNLSSCDKHLEWRWRRHAVAA